MSSGVILLAAGRGARFGSSTPKQFVKLGKIPLYLHSLRVFLKLPSVREIVIVVHPRQFKSMSRSVLKMKTRVRLSVVPGGAFRGQSVKHGLLAFSRVPKVVLVHDAARPLVTTAIARRVERAAQRYGAALAAWPLPDTLKLADRSARVQKTVPRKNLWLAQTPQGFSRKVAMDCLLRPHEEATDDADLVQRTGRPVHVVEGASSNIKVTYASDLKICEGLLK